MITVNEKTTLVITVAFYDENDLPVVPDSGTYKIHDKYSGTVLVAATSIVSLASVIDILLPTAATTMNNTALHEEIHVVTVDVLYDVSTKRCTSEYQYKVRNLVGVTV